MGLYCVSAKLTAEEEKSDITKLDVVELSEAEADPEEKESEAQKKRDSGYSYSRPDRFRLNARARFPSGHFNHKGRIVFRNPGQINRPFTKYGPPSHQNSPLAKPGTHGQQNRDNLHHHGHFGQQPSNNFNGRPGSLLQQEVPSPIRHFDFSEASPIASQNNEPFGSNTANYLPPQNQKLPGYTSTGSFALQQFQNQAIRNQNIVQSTPQQISDAALFLTQNAQAIQQLYGAPATSQDFAPNNEDFPNSDNVQNLHPQFQNLDVSSQRSHGYQGALPSYASGTLNAQETLEQIQSFEKDRLIVQLQRALAEQSQSQDTSGRYAQNQVGYTQNQELLAALEARMKQQGLQQSTAAFASANPAFNQSPFLPGTTVGPLGFGYGLSTTTQTPTTTTTTTTLAPHGGEGTSQVGVSLPPASQPAPPPSAGFPVYGGFVPTLITGPSFVAGLPSYGAGVLPSSPVQPSGSSPTHFGIPIPADPAHKPVSPPTTLPPSSPAAPPSPPLPGTSHPVHTVPLQPVHPVQPVATPLHPVHPVATPLHPVHPVTTPLQPGTSVQNPAAAAPGHPAYGLQTPLINPLLYKPVKAVYPLYYYPNLAYHLQKPALPTYPWSYAPSYAKPAQIWK
ncbi:hypothetical protein KM043_018377 [Ampulex compressa]|nr:hypothetical protein KM043_018377 [Ampulex compressa]